MKTKTLIIIILATIIFPFSINAQKAFKAKMTDRKPGNKMHYTVQSNGEKYRYDFIESGKKGIVIVNPVKGQTAILWPEKKIVHYTETSSSTSRSNDPVQAVMTLKDRYTEKILETEEIAGYKCTKSELYASDQKIFTLWFSEELSFPLRVENNLTPNTSMQLSDIEVVEIAATIFEVPEDYTEVDNRMRPIIPGPPAPEQWNTIETNLPENGEFQRGDLIKFNIPKTCNYVFSLKNNSSNPAKIIRKSFRDGKELPNNEQGPLKYRTRRLFDNESFKNTYNWKEGNTVVLEVHEGKLSIEIKAENE